MKQCIYILGLLFFISSCENAEKAKLLDQRQKELIQKEKNLGLLEQSLMVREAAISLKEQKIDSASRQLANDSLVATRPALDGSWNVKMSCIETTCSTSAVGDIKTEQWEISHEDNLIIVKSMGSDKTGRIYSGKFTGDMIELAAMQDSTVAGRSTKMIVRLQPSKENEMEGQRQITRGDDCKIVYALQLKKTIITAE